MKRVVTSAITCLFALGGGTGAEANGVSFTLGLAVPERCRITAAETRPASPDLQRVTIAADCNLERFSIRIAGLAGEGDIARAEAAEGEARVGAANQVDVRASRPGRQIVHILVPAGAADAILPQLVA